MPYSTRRKSLSLPSLGIQLPRSTRPHRSNSKPDSQAEPSKEQSPPAKRVKRDHNSPSSLPSPRRTPSADVGATKPLITRHGAHTPPPSPGDVVAFRKIDLDGINDDVVISVIEQLEKTGNRPHLIKELATILLATNQNIAHSANPAALLSSRLTQYMKRPWTALSPCPIAKELIPVHPRKVFFFLTTRPRGELPSSSDDIITPVISDIKRLTPSISDPSVEDEESLDRHERMRFSPSPEVELFTPEFEHNTPPVPGTPSSSFGSHTDLSAENPQQLRQRPSNRAPSPGLEADERGFTETASAVRASRLLQQTSQLQISVHEPVEELKPRTEQDVSMELFGRPHGALSVVENLNSKMMSSPIMIPKHNLTLQVHDIDMDIGEASWNIKSPENTSFDELDQMLDDF